MTNEDETPESVPLKSAAPLTPQNRALVEAGREMFLASITSGREFCKFMVGISSGSLPVYLALLKFIHPWPQTLSVWMRIAVVLPVVFFIVAILFFVRGCFPKRTQFSLNVIEDIQYARNATIAEMRRHASLGLWSFMTGTVLAVFVITAGILFAHQPPPGTGP